MDNSGMLRGLLFVGLLSILCHGQASQEVSAEDFGVEKPEPAADRDLVSIWRASQMLVYGGMTVIMGQSDIAGSRVL